MNADSKLTSKMLAMGIQIYEKDNDMRKDKDMRKVINKGEKSRDHQP